MHAPTTPEIRTTCRRILELLLPYRRALPGDGDAPPSQDALAPQFAQIGEFVADGEPVVLTLPAFPCKSPNPEKVLGHLPDMGERVALRFLHELCTRIETVYAPGAKVLICSDGHVFADLIGVRDDVVDEYAAALHDMICQESDRIDTFDLRHVYGELSIEDKRARLMREYGQSYDSLREEIHSDDNTVQLYRGISKFMEEDSVASEFPGSRSAWKRDCRARAHGVILRSRAWGSLIKDVHPRSARMSIHPQPWGAEKFGLSLIGDSDGWVTPWHAVAVRENGRFTLVKRSVAEARGELVCVGGMPSHYEFVQPSGVPVAG